MAPIIGEHGPYWLDSRARLRVLGIPGSLRARSYNRALLRAARQLAPAGMSIEPFEIGDIPPYNADVEAKGDPEPVVALKRAIAEADALLIASPEYNRGTPGVLKNAIDWASRPPLASPLAGKPVAVMGASTGMSGTRHAQEQLRQALSFPGAFVVEGGELCVGEAFMKIDDEGRILDPEIREAVQRLLEALAAAVPERAAVVDAGR